MIPEITELILNQYAIWEVNLKSRKLKLALGPLTIWGGLLWILICSKLAAISQNYKLKEYESQIIDFYFVYSFTQPSRCSQHTLDIDSKWTESLLYTRHCVRGLKYGSDSIPCGTKC